MLARYGVGAFLVTAALLAVGPPARAQQKSAGPQTVKEADELYPKAYVCSDIKYTQVDDKPGLCTADKTPLVPIRLGIAYKCLRGPADYQANEGECVTDNHRPKGPVTVSVFWNCEKQQGTRYLEPGKCGDGTPRQIQFEERPHGDHNTRHGGDSIFMSPDLFYHVEGTYSASGEFRAYFYNEFTKPLKVGGITGSVALANSNNIATGAPIPLTPVNIADGNALEAKIPNAPVPSKAANVYFKLYIKLKPGAPDWVTDHQFPDYSKDPAPPAPARPSTTGGAARANQPGAARTPAQPAAAGRATQPGNTPGTTARAAAPSTTPKPSAPKPSTPAASAPKPPAAAPPVAAAPPATTAQETQPSGGVMAGGAEVGGGPTGPQVVLPEKTPDLLAFLKASAANVKELLDQGQLGGMWYPALNAKDAGLALDANHHEGLNDAQRAQLASDVKQLTVVAWQIDSAGDLGNRTQLDQLTRQFEATVNDILALYGR